MFGVPDTSEFTKPSGSYELYGFSFRKKPGKSLEVRFNCSAAAGRAPNWTGRPLNSS